MDAVSTILGVGVFSALIFFFSFQIEKEKHYLLRLFLVFVAMAVLILIPKSLIDEQYTCESVVANSTDVNATVTTYEYESFCYTRTEETPTTFYNIVLWFYRIFIGYVIVYLFIMALQWLYESYKKGKV